MAALIKTSQPENLPASASQPQKNSSHKTLFNSLITLVKSTIRIWKTDQSLRIIVSLGLILIGYLFWLLLTGSDGEIKSVVSLTVLVAFGLLNTVLAARIARRFVSNQRLRRAWVQLAIGFAIYTTGNILVLGDSLIVQIDFVTTWIPNLFYLISCPFFLAGLWHFPQTFRSREDSGRFYLNTGMVLTGVGVALWYLLVYPTTDGSRGSNEFVLSLTYLSGNFALLFGVVIISLRPFDSNNRDTLNFLIIALLCCFIGSVGYSFLSLHHTYLNGAYPDVFYTLGLFFFALGAFYQWRELSRREFAEAEIINITNPVARITAAEIIAEQSGLSFLPYFSIGIGYGALFFAAYSFRATSDNSPLTRMILGAATLTAFVIARQVLTVRENTRLHAEQVHNLSEKRFRSLVQNSSDAVLIIGKDLVIRYVTPSVERVFGYLPDDIIGRKFIELAHPDDVPQVLGYFKNLISKGGLSASVEWRLLNKTGEWIYVENTGNNLFEDENVRGIVVNSRNVTDRRRVEDRMLHDAFHDALTGLPNRALFLDHLQLTLSRIKRSESALFAVLFIDLDRFKYVNDSLGHHAGDLLLIEVARRIEGCLRPSDTVARLGGDEFTILIEDIASLEEAKIVAERVRLKIFEPFNLDGREFITTVSIGIALGNTEYNNAENVLRDADTAMYHAKVGGKAQFAVFDQAMHARVISTMETEADMRRAIERQEFFLLYQPIISTSKYTLSGFEALVRWQHPTRGVIPPDDFIPLAEETGLIIPISLWILREVGKQCAIWREYLPGAPLTVSVNISCKHFQQPDLVEQVARVLHETGLNASALKLEITESAVMENTERTAEKLKGLRALGIELSLDDFGTGYSSLSYLHRFPLDILKIDRSFVSRLEDEGEHFEIVKTIIVLAKTLGMKTVAEGVETERQFIKLQNLNCDFAQGFFFSKPLPVTTIDEMLANMRESIF